MLFFVKVRNRNISVCFWYKGSTTLEVCIYFLKILKELPIINQFDELL